MSMNLIWVFLSALFVILADAFIKKVSLQGSFTTAFLDPWMLLAYALYFLQIILAIIVFTHKGELAIYANLYVVFYSLLGVIVGVLVFKESLSALQIVGGILAIIAAILLNWS